MSMAKKTTPAACDPAKTLRLRECDYPGKNQEQIIAEMAQSSISANTATTLTFSAGTFGKIDLTCLIDAMRDKVAKVQRGDMADMEALLVAQATALDAIFNEMARRAALNMGEYIKAADTYMRLALKAQSQSRCTVEALAEIKNPRPVAFVKQANIAHGPQQVNNGTLAHGNNSISSNELSGAGNELLPDARASQVEGRIDRPLEAVGEIYGAANGGREGYQCSQ
jgi:hypothetical protein